MAITGTVVQACDSVQLAGIHDHASLSRPGGPALWQGDAARNGHSGQSMTPGGLVGLGAGVGVGRGSGREFPDLTDEVAECLLGGVRIG
jgi:hypothetical protein